MAGTVVAPERDLAAAGAFMQKGFGDLMGMISTALVVIGDRLGLFVALDAGGPATSAELAARAGISERYAREWLAGMACAGYLTYDAANARYTLPSAHAAVVADEDGPLFLGGIYDIFGRLWHTIDDLIAAFRTGGGLPQSAYHPQTWEAMERETAPTFEHVLLDGWIAGTPDVRARLEGGASLADIGCGSGRAIIKLARAFANSRFTGYDAFAPQVERARANIEAADLADRVAAEVANGEVGLPGQFDIITTFDVVHDAVDPLALLRSIRRALKPDGIYVMQEFASGDTVEDNIATGALGTFLYGASVLYCTPVALAGGGAALGTAGLPESKVRALSERAGFRTVRRVPVENPFHALYELRP